MSDFFNLVETAQGKDKKFEAAVEFIKRTGSSQFQIRYSDDETPMIWFAVSIYKDGKFEVDAGKNPTEATLRLCERLCDGGMCVHCKRPTGLNPNSLQDMPMSNMICWYQYDPELNEFRRGCEGDIIGRTETTSEDSSITTE